MAEIGDLVCIQSISTAPSRGKILSLVTACRAAAQIPLGAAMPRPILCWIRGWAGPGPAADDITATRDDGDTIMPTFGNRLRMTHFILLPPTPYAV